MLASVADVEAITGSTYTGSDVARVERLLEMASATVAGYCTGAQLEPATSTVAFNVGSVRELVLPKPPIVSVTGITQNGLTVTSGAWHLSGPRLARLYGGWDGAWRGDVVVTYTHGYDPTPDDVAAVVAEVAAGMLGANYGSQQIQREQLDDHLVMYRDVVAPFTPEQMSRLKRYRTTARSASVREHHVHRRWPVA